MRGYRGHPLYTFLNESINSFTLRVNQSCKVALTFVFVIIDNSRSYGVTIQIESCWELLYCGTAVYFAVRVVRTFECMDKILWCDHSNESR